jgi:hypothetical protein
MKLIFKQPLVERLNQAICDAEVRERKIVERIELSIQEFHTLCHETGSNWFEEKARTFHGIRIRVLEKPE